MAARFRIRPLLISLALATSLAGCAVPLGPGFQLRNRQIRLGPESASPVLVHVRVTDTMENAGNRPLDYLDVRMPFGPSFGLANLSVRMDERELDVRPVSDEPDAPFRVPFDPPWPVEERRTFVFDYDLTPAAPRTYVAVTADAFHVAATTTFPQWLAPPSAFARADLRAREERFDVMAPAGYSVLAAGREQGTRREGEATVHRYRLSPEQVNPFVIAGAYLEQQVETPQGSAVFWTLDPLDAQAGQIATRRLVGTVIFFGEVFGPIPGRAGPLFVVETPAEMAPVDEVDSRFSALPFPRGVLLGGAAFDAGIASEPVLRLAEYELARSWFGWHVRVGEESQSLLSRGVSLYAVILAASAREGQDTRRRDIRSLLESYDSEYSLSSRAPSPDSRTGDGFSARKAALFLAELDDKVGHAAFESALQRLFYALRGYQVLEYDLRAALEDASGQDLAAVFRMWRSQPGIPESFRARYSAGP